MQTISKPETPPNEKRLPATVSVPVWLVEALDAYAAAASPPSNRSQTWGWLLETALKTAAPRIHAAYAPK